MVLTLEEIEKRINDSYEIPNNVLTAVPTPMVTIRTSTYQHGPYIKECIEGVLMQKTTFPVEFIIGEDFSTDGTREIVFEYAKKFPDIIRVITADYNVGSKANGKRCILASRGKYMAQCEGDDYWTDPLKLQKQVDFLEANEEYGLVHTNTRVSSGNALARKKYNKDGLYLNDFLKGECTISTLTVMYRRDLYEKLPKLFQGRDFKMGDLPLWIEFAQFSKIYYLPKVTALYRELEESASHNKDIDTEISFHKSALEVRLFYIRMYNLPSLKKESLVSFYSGVVKIAFDKNDKKTATKYFKKIIQFGFPGTKTILFYLGTKIKELRYTIKIIYKVLGY